jgi:hypothetical protein
MKKISMFLLCVVAASTSIAQQTFTDITLKENPHCAFNSVLQKAGIDYSELIDAYRSRAAMNRAPENGPRKLYDIPVVFHIVYGSGQSALNLADSIIINQVDVLNKAFRKLHADTANTRSIFKPLSTDTEIQFHLATKDPQGNPTTGITRTVSKRAFFGDSNGDLDSLERVKKTAQGGIDPWPTTNYFNIWICNMSDSKGQLSVLGYGIPPLNPLPNNWPAGTDISLKGLIDGVVLQTHCVGSNNKLNAQLQGMYTKGRAAVHEVGHYLGLQHIFGSTAGDNAANCGTALITDGMNDTPEQALISFTQNKLCPDAAKNSCGSGTGDLPDMWENYMDYTIDACQTLFTKDQAALMKSVLEDQRHTLFDVTGMEEEVPAVLALYPNPAASDVNILSSEKIKKLIIVNYMGQVVSQFGENEITQHIDIRDLPTGSYLFLIEGEHGKRATAKCNVIR